MNAMAAGGTGRGHGQAWRMLGWGGAALLLCLPAAMMRFAPQAGFDWSASDFVGMGVLFGLVGLGIELAVRALGSLAYRAAAIVAGPPPLPTILGEPARRTIRPPGKAHKWG